ncbi:MAG: hypothetical protein R3B72_48350 [Polyangiaceae bacterium]
MAKLNGFILRGGALHVRGVTDDPPWHSLRKYWHGESALYRSYRSLRPGDLPFAQDCVGDQFFLRDSVVWQLSAETDDVESIQVSLFEFLAKASGSPLEFLSAEPLATHRDAGQELHPGQLLFAYPPFCVGEAGLEVSLKAIPADEVIRVHAKLAAQIRDLPDGHKIRIDTPDAV